MTVEAFFSYARERYTIKLRRDASNPAPWTDDPVLQQYRFCNIFREDDRVTSWMRQWINEHIASEHNDSAALHLRSAVVFRYLNRLETGQHVLYLLANPMPLDDFLFELERDLRRLIAEAPILGAAYMIKTPLRRDKVSGLMEIWRGILVDEHRLVRDFRANNTLQWATHTLAQYSYCGPFMAYEIVTDLRHTTLLNTATDIMSWANPGPGAMRGVARIRGLPAADLHRGNREHVEMAQETMRMLLGLSQDNFFWSPAWPLWEMRDVEHTLCEFDKYQRARLGEGRPKQTFKPMETP